VKGRSSCTYPSDQDVSEVRGWGGKSQPLSPGEIGCDRDGHTTDTHLKVRKNQTH
jgi:hypothetical protein